VPSRSDKIIQSYPNLIRQGYVELLPLSDARARHKQLLDFGSSSLIYLACIACAEYRAFHERDKTTERLLLRYSQQALSPGRWAKVLRHMSRLNDHTALPRDVSRKLTDLAEAARFVEDGKRLDEALEMGVGDLCGYLTRHAQYQRKVSTLHFWDALVEAITRYKHYNEMHPEKPLPEAYYGLLNGSLEPALVEVIEYFEVLHQYKLAEIRKAEPTAEGVFFEFVVHMGGYKAPEASSTELLPGMFTTGSTVLLDPTLSPYIPFTFNQLPEPDRALLEDDRISELNPSQRQAFCQLLRLAWADGVITAPEREILETHRVQLRIPADEAASLEREMAPRSRSAASSEPADGAASASPRVALDLDGYEAQDRTESNEVLARLLRESAPHHADYAAQQRWVPGLILEEIHQLIDAERALLTPIDIPLEQRQLPSLYRVAGPWQGWYSQYRRRTYFNIVVIPESDEEFTGYSLEPLNPKWGHKYVSDDVTALHASLAGTLDVDDNDQLVWEKRYLHENMGWVVGYQGALLGEGEMEGTWEVRSRKDGKVRFGAFSAVSTTSFVPMRIEHEEKGELEAYFVDLNDHWRVGTWAGQIRLGKTWTYALAKLWPDPDGVVKGVILREGPADPDTDTLPWVVWAVEGRWEYRQHRVELTETRLLRGPTCEPMVIRGGTDVRGRFVRGMWKTDTRTGHARLYKV